MSRLSENDNLSLAPASQLGGSGLIDNAREVGQLFSFGQTFSRDG